MREKMKRDETKQSTINQAIVEFTLAADVLLHAQKRVETL